MILCHEVRYSALKNLVQCHVGRNSYVVRKHRTFQRGQAARHKEKRVEEGRDERE